jgi:hypothetical protein
VRGSLHTRSVPDELVPCGLSSRAQALERVPRGVQSRSQIGDSPLLFNPAFVRCLTDPLPSAHRRWSPTPRALPPACRYGHAWRCDRGHAFIAPTPERCSTRSRTRLGRAPGAAR